MAFRSQTTNVTIVSGTTSVGTMPAGVTTGDRVFAFIGSGGANPDTLTAPAGWTKLGEYAPTGFLKTSLFYVDIAAGNATSHAAGTTHTWTFTSSGRNIAVLLAYSGTDLTRAPAWAGASGTADSAGPHNVPPLTIPANDWELILAAARESPGTDDPKTWTIAGGTGDVERVDAYGTNTGTGAKLAVAAYDTNAAASGGGGSTVTLTGAPPLNTINALSLTSPARIGATLDREQSAIDYWEPRLVNNGWMRIFPDTDKLPPDWEDRRYAYCQRVGAHPFISTKIDGDTAKIQALYDYLMLMPAWIKDDPDMLLWFTEHHEPEKEYAEKYGSKASGASHYIADYKAVWNKLATLPAGIRNKIRMGPALTKQWTESASKGNFDYQPFDPGPSFRQFKGYDVYADSNSGSTAITSFPNPATFLQYIKADNAGGQPKIFVEWGVIGAPFDVDGTARAAWIQGCHDEALSWGSGVWGGGIWWNDHGTPSTASITGIGTQRYFELNLRHTGTDGSSTEIPSVTTTVSVGGGGGSGSARTVTLSKPASHTHVWSATIPMPAPAAPAPTNPWSCMGLPQR